MLKHKTNVKYLYAKGQSVINVSIFVSKHDKESISLETHSYGWKVDHLIFVTKLKLGSFCYTVEKCI